MKRLPQAAVVLVLAWFVLYPTEPLADQSQCLAENGRACQILAWNAFVAKNYLLALPLFQSSCHYQHGPGCTGVAYMVEKGLGGLRDLDTALRYYEEGCNLGDPPACSSVGLFHEFGKSQAGKDNAKATLYYMKGCEGGHARGCLWLGHLYLSSEDPTDWAEGLRWSKRAHELDPNLRERTLALE